MRIVNLRNFVSEISVDARSLIILTVGIMIFGHLEYGGCTSSVLKQTPDKGLETNYEEGS